MALNYRLFSKWKLQWIVTLVVLNLPSTYEKNFFPVLEYLSALKPISSSSTCGATASKYCESAPKDSSLNTCTERTCKFDCCANCGSQTPSTWNLENPADKTNIQQSSESRPGSSDSSSGFFGNSYIRPFRIPTINHVEKGFTVSAWIKQEAGNKGTIFCKFETSGSFSKIYQIVVQDYNLRFFYQTAGGNVSSVSVNLLQSQSEKLQPDEWHLITVAVINVDLSYYIDGELMNINSALLSGAIDDSSGDPRIGQYNTGVDQFRGLMQDMVMYDRALTNREAIEAFTGVLPPAYVASDCRCPPTHPKINDDEPAKCLKNTDNPTSAVSRLSDTAHPVEFCTDNDLLSFWLSEITDNVTIDINLEVEGLQVFYIVLTFYGPFPEGIVIERSVDGGNTFQPWQYFAEDCVASFGLDNNGQLLESDAVNCVQYPKPLKASTGAISFQTEYPPPEGSDAPIRPYAPGCSNLYCSERLLQFLKASHVRFHFYNHTLVQFPQHRYFGLNRILVAGRCECFGHANTSSTVPGNATHLGHCKCDCQSSTNTEGDTCNRCKPLYNNKPFKRGDKSDSYPCVKCECYDHADSCVYNQTLDSNPESRSEGGGGVCVDCKHNTTGRFCDICKKEFFRESGKSRRSPDVCTHCGCTGPGVLAGKADCVQDDSDPSVLAGQCDCKSNTTGRQCDQCKDGFFDLKASHASGCVPCMCELDGTRNRKETCNATTGQCDCKERVSGVKCDTCKRGFWGLSGLEPLGCKTCDCDPFGTTSGTVNQCDAVSGQCSCKQGSEGRKCDRCTDGYHSLQQDGCKSCNCSIEGTIASQIDSCNKTTGRCTCKLNVEGINCDRCKSGYYDLAQSNPQGCTQCSCDIKGTVGGAGQCDLQSGNCSCKPNVIGQSCNQCKPGTFGLNQSDPNGCQPCNCYPKGTVDGDKTDPDKLQCSSNGQCSCLSSVTGLRCDACVNEYYWNPSAQGCLQCNCNPDGSVGKNCNDTGQCTCKANIGGRQCNTCENGYYGFEIDKRCQPCNCNVSGSLSTECDEVGKCECKQNVEGLKCDQCKNGTVNLQQNNKFGCSGAPSEQPAPFVTVLSSRTIMLTWSPPDNPNGIILRYELYRNGSLVYTGSGQKFNDTSLTPNTAYYYYIITYTERGNTRSLDDGNVYITFADAPEGVSPPTITNILPRNLTATWQKPNMTNGRITDYRLISTSSRSSVEVVHCSGIILSCHVGNLKPYTAYNFTLEVCTNGGCGRSEATAIVTRPTLPDYQPPPTVTSLPGGTAVLVEWDPPPEPNGRIFRYELYMRASPFTGIGSLVYDSNPAHDPNPLNFRRANVTGLRPFTDYEFMVRTYTADVNGDRGSNWTRAKTGEGTPLDESAMSPSASPHNSSAISVVWNPPHNPQGAITRYQIYKYQPPSSNVAVLALEVPGALQRAVVDKLDPYTEYKFTVKACNSFACSGHSPEATARTTPAAPEGQSPPSVLSVNSSTVHLTWTQPQTPNGPLPPSYNVSRAFAAFYWPSPLVTAGVHFPGKGFYKFPHIVVPASATNDIEFSFRTLHPYGLLLFLASDGLQTDMLAVELRIGKPWLAFDCQDGLANFTISESVRFDDGKWHHVRVRRIGQQGTLYVDAYQATRNSPGSATVIATNTGVYFGGLPDTFTITRPEKVQRFGFVGCLAGVSLEGKKVEWSSALDSFSVEPEANGCPARSINRAVLLRGGGFAAFKNTIFKDDLYNFSLYFRSQLSSGILLFARGPTSTIAIQFSRDTVKIKFSTSAMQDIYSVVSSADLCDGNWHNLTLASFVVNLYVELDQERTTFPGITQLRLTSALYIGGVPWASLEEAAALQFGVDVTSSFGGCVRLFSSGLEIDYVRTVTSQYNTDFDGCLPESTVPISSEKGSCLPFNSSVVYSGKKDKFYDNTVEAFTDYLYRVESYHVGILGSGQSPWIYTRSGQGAPTGLQAPTQLIPLPGGRTVNVTWEPPQRPNGVLTEYRILAYPVLPPGTAPLETVETDTSVLNKVISGLTPFTTYEIRIQASTVGGSGVGPGANVTTEEAVPEGVTSPSAVRHPRELEVFWSEPSRPNGIITQYNLTLDGQLVYSGVNRNFTVDNLQVYTEYALQLVACTRIGCAQGPSVRIRTGELPPEGVETPVVVVRGRTEVEVSWKVPLTPNGAIILYEVLFATNDVLSAYVSRYNATPNEFRTVIGNLTAGTLYFVRVRPFTGGGGTFSGAANVTTHEDIPDDIPAPRVVALSPYALFVIMLPPEKPNGVITRYELYQGTLSLVLNVTELTNYTASGFTPYSRHTFRVRACTMQGCAFGAEAEAYTLEISPNGTVRLSVSVVNATTVTARWTPVAVPNGRLFYKLMIRGMFLVPGTLKTEERTELAILSEEADKDFTYSGLLPFNGYTFWVNASNSVGFILSNNISDSTPEGVPDGLRAPNASALNSTAILVTWQEPALPNGIILDYEVHQRSGGVETVLFRGVGFSLTITGLSPFTVYEYRVNASTIAGTGFSPWSSVQTLEDVPGSLDAPRPGEASPTSILLNWDPPNPANGKLLHYIIYQNNTEVKRVMGNVTSYNVTGLQPFTVYVFKLSACNSIGCSNSSYSRPRTTSQSGPEGLSAPSLSSPSARLVIIEWNAPSKPNGIMQSYQIQRRQLGDVNLTVITEVSASAARRYEDRTARPVTAYQYRVVGKNDAGLGDPSPYSDISTGEGDPEQIPAPTVTVLSPYAIKAKWSEPAIPNGNVTHYIILARDHLNSTNVTVEAHARFDVNVTSLRPFVRYNVSVIACTSGGCGTSPTVEVRTLAAKPDGQPPPTAEAQSSTSLLVKWDPPVGANAPIVGYMLLRRTLEEPVSNNFPGPTGYVEVFESGPLQREYLDVGLAIFSLQQYKVTVVTTEGNDTSDPSLAYRTGPAPPLTGPIVNASALNQSAVLVTWYPPGIKQLRGTVKTYIVEVEDTSHQSRPVNRVGTYPGNQTRVIVTGLKPNTVYIFYVELDNGAGKFKSQGAQTKTLDGLPTGFAAPALYTISSTELRVSWNPPTEPNGKIVSYKIYVNDTLWANTSGEARQVVLAGLQPFSFYVITVDVCTSYGCTKSDPTGGVTNSGAPTGLSAPRLTAGPTFMVIEWDPPSNPNGIIVVYEVYRRMVYPCPTSPPPKSKCTFIECLLSEQICGVACYNPANEMCCNGVLHPRDPLKSCCGTNYLQKNQASDICCGNNFHSQRAEYQCCHGDYIRVSSGSVCCRTALGGRVVGPGNSCCGDTPYDVNNPSQVCVCGALYAPVPPRKCCGGKVVSTAQVCCGDDVKGAAFDLESSKTCCGTQYVVEDTSLCCQSSVGDIVVYNYTSAADKLASNDKCCGKERVASSLSCCNERGYDPGLQTCADKSSNGTLGCGTGTVCNNSDANVAMCDRCDFDNTTLNCGFFPGYYAPTPTTVEPPLCATEYKKVLENKYDKDLRNFTDTDLEPHTVYRYYVVAINNAGNGSSPEAEKRTLMDRPEGLQPPVAVTVSSSFVLVTWKEPVEHNGIIQAYRLKRRIAPDGPWQTVYTGLNMTFTDHGLEPFTGYLYQIEACTTECASAEMTSPIYTDQAAPAYVNETILQALNSSAINVSWFEPSKPNGVIIRYDVSLVVNNTFKIHLNPGNNGLDMSLVVSGLKPYTSYAFEVVACTKVGCTASSLASTLTLQAPPEGVHPPNLTVTGARQIEAAWTEPDVLNGVILTYTLYRGNIVVYNGTDACYKNRDGKDTCIFKDEFLQPVTLYNYSVAATTSGGTTRSGITSATTPESSPEGVPKPRLTVRDAYNIDAEWDPPSRTNGAITSYSVVVNGTEVSAGLNRSLLITGLKPYTVYSVQVKACTVKGCGIGDREHIRTDQAPPEGQGPPTLVAQEWNVVQISWTPPSSPNGIITRYEIFRKIGSGAPVQVCLTLSLTCLNSGLSGYTVYSYKVRAVNIKGHADGPWMDVRTLEGPPQGIAQPSLNVINSTAVQVSWTAPSHPNGIVTNYEVRYREELLVPDNPDFTVAARLPSDVFNLTVSGLMPHTDYQFVIAAINSRREGTSDWAVAKTKQAPPSGLKPLQADKAPDGKSIRIFWDEPGMPNGRITHYKLYKDGVQIYAGATREYTVRKLVPFTSYEFQLEACTVAGCTLGPVQIIYSAQIDPEGQAPPTVAFVNETTVVLNWKPPAVPNGVIIRYEIYRTQAVSQKRRRRSLASPQRLMIYSTNNTNNTDFQYTDTGLKPFTMYGYSIRSVNQGGFIDSDPVTVTTSQAAPTAVDTPAVIAINAYSINVTWRQPAEPNGVIQFYFVHRNDSIKYKGNELFFVDQVLDPYTVYSYTVEACTAGGCTTSPPSSQRTAQAAPTGVHPPVLVPLSALAVKISWVTPEKPNGIITKYQVFEVGDSSPQYEGPEMTVTVSNKLPFTKYSFYVGACTHVGCTTSPSAEVRTMEAAPSDLDAPIATVAGSSVVRVEWKPPRTPNGFILYYLLTRNGTLVYNGTDVKFEDSTVKPFTVYAYVVTAENSAGRISSPPGISAPTNPGRPDNVSVPDLEVLSATSLKVSWREPGRPNGVITKYVVVYNFKGAQGNAESRDAGKTLELTLIGLLPYTLYEVRIQACTQQGCSTGESNDARTLEAPPEQQSAPTFPGSHIGARSILVTWNMPQKPNGFIVQFSLYRRESFLSNNQVPSYGPELLVVNITNGSALEYTDNSVKPFSRYEYRVVSRNGVGQAGSAWSAVQTLSAPPEQLKAPEVLETSSVTMRVRILPPDSPNGEIRDYVLEISGRNYSNGTQTERDVIGLEPFTDYVLRVFVCTDGGCTAGPTMTQRTAEGVPAGFDAPRAVAINETEITIAWDEPLKPSGQIKRYEVLHGEFCSTDCPDVATMNGTNVDLRRSFSARDLQPYTMYKFIVRVSNTLYSKLSDDLLAQTLASDPRITGIKPRVNVSGLRVSVDWSECFELNGPLETYQLLENGLLMYEGQQNKKDLGTRNVGEYTYVAKATTLVKGRKVTVTAPASGPFQVDTEIVEPTPAAREADTEWYMSAWFIALMSLVLIILLLILVACLLRRTSGGRTVFVREREPLPPPLKSRSRPPSSSSLYAYSDRKNGSMIDLVPMHAPYNSSTAAMYDSTERLHSMDHPGSYSGSLRKVPLDDTPVWDGYYNKSFSNRDSGLFDDEKEDLSDSEPGTPYVSLRKEHYFTDTHL